MTEMELGKARITYEDPDEGTVRMTVDNEHIAYFQDHWIVRVDGGDDEELSEADADEPDVVRRIPAHRVYHVERSVEEFEQEVQTLKDQVQSFTRDVRRKILGGSERSGSTSETRTNQESIEIEVDDGDSERYSSD